MRWESQDGLHLYCISKKQKRTIATVFQSIIPCQLSLALLSLIQCCLLACLVCYASCFCVLLLIAIVLPVLRFYISSNRLSVGLFFFCNDLLLSPNYIHQKLFCPSFSLLTLFLLMFIIASVVASNVNVLLWWRKHLISPVVSFSLLLSMSLYSFVLSLSLSPYHHQALLPWP